MKAPFIYIQTHFFKVYTLRNIQSSNLIEMLIFKMLKNILKNMLYKIVDIKHINCRWGVKAGDTCKE